MSVTQKAHGMDGTLVEPDWPPLTLAETRAVLAHYPALSEPAEIVSNSPRPLSAAAVVRTSAGKVFIKRHHGTVRDVEGLLEEHRFLAHLHESGARVPRVFASRSGQTALSLGEWTYEVHETPGGVDLYEEAISWTPFHTTAHAYAAGQAQARLHIAAREYDAPARKPRPLVASFSIFAAGDPGAALEHYLRARPALASSDSVRRNCEEAMPLLAPFHAQLVPLSPALPPLWTHNDLHASNLFWSDRSDGATATAVIDFGLSDRTNAIHDLANTIERNIVEWLVLVNDPAHPDDVPVHFDHLHALLDGYTSVRPLFAEEAAALAPMTALCHAEFALSEADYFLSALHSDEKAAMAYDGWLVGHARWFHSSAGRRLLDAINRWAASRSMHATQVGAL
jgi:Ser/Thr protein kinase RdoA (MazF antagonist)